MSAPRTGSSTGRGSAGWNATSRGRSRKHGGRAHLLRALLAAALFGERLAKHHLRQNFGSLVVLARLVMTSLLANLFFMLHRGLLLCRSKTLAALAQKPPYRFSPVSRKK